MTKARAGELSVLPRSFYRRPADKVAPALLGRYIVRREAGARLILRIVETEAYLGAGDPASHAWGGRRTARTSALFRPGGCAYVYLVYGLHHMLNVVTESEEEGSAVLIRAGEPVAGERAMLRNRGLVEPIVGGALAGGPGRLCQALGIDLDDNRSWLDGESLRICRGRPSSPSRIVAAPRVGVDYAGEAASWALRFVERENPNVSRPRPW